MKYSCKWYGNEAHTENVWNVKGWRERSRKHYTAIRAMPKKMAYAELEKDSQLLAFNKEKFTKHWGKQNFCWSSEFRFFCWVREIDGVSFVVMTAAGKGTCYEYVPSKKSQKDVFAAYVKLEEEIFRMEK